jgi:hypothetical protein
MTKKLESLFNLEDSTPTKVEAIPVEVTKDDARSLEQSFREVERISKSLPSLDGVEDMGDAELDALAKKAEDAYDDLMDLGMNVEVRYSGRIFEVAASMMGNAINAKTAKIDKKLKVVDLQLKKLKIDRDTPDSAGENIVNGSGYIITDRNDLLKKLRGGA